MPHIPSLKVPRQNSCAFPIASSNYVHMQASMALLLMMTTGMQLTTIG